ncbi:putative 2-oxoglutarate and Fe(II)-dependent oxygenase superfamily protein [Quillaja saponaria]|uniref:2-oxoglutarate and Fe(II)-dependent oxygenase superfamily protein n=1 Tax=Quillaja saponaria TaxID=32244 RepID=A0AAD7PI18_QUISA|nr:putative 2-oxoglutarate and Fe(II)-dependent oxygenase superfamily protein [Quillaja saponaria]
MSMAMACIPTIDLSAFTEGDSDGNKKTIVDKVGQACSEYGFFQIINHGIPLSLMRQALDMSKTFFDYPLEEKLKSSPIPGSPLAAGFNIREKHLTGKEYLVTTSPSSSFNVYPANPPGYRDLLIEMFTNMVKLSSTMAGIISECLGLPPDFLEEFNNDRSWDVLTSLSYPAATDDNGGNIGVAAHKDVSCFTFVYQDQSGGLEVKLDGKWVPILPATEDALVVNVGDMLQVLSNDKFMSPWHRVVKLKGRARNSFVFFYNLAGDKFIEPLPQFTKEVGVAPKYTSFLNKEYLQLRSKTKLDLTAEGEQKIIDVTHYAINTT